MEGAEARALLLPRAQNLEDPWLGTEAIECSRPPSSTRGGGVARGKERFGFRQRGRFVPRAESVSLTQAWLRQLVGF